MKKIMLLALGFIMLMSSCGDDENTTTSDQFRVTITNTFETKEYLESGSIGFIMPGESAEISFHAGKGHYLQFATMFVQSNDIFFAPDDTGIRLYDDQSQATTGDITSQISLWDAGTEVNEQPGVGPNQAPRQAGENTGTTENGNVLLLSDVNDGFVYPEVSELASFTLSHDGGTLFTLAITNTSANSAIPTPFAPGVWVIHNSEQKPIFTEGNPSSEGLEDIAEDGNNSISNAQLEMVTGLVSPFAPGAYNVGQDNEIFERNGANTPAIEALAEDGDPSNYQNVFNTPDGATDAGPIFPSGSYSFTFEAEDSDKLSLALMLVQSNDWFVGLNEFELYTDGVANTGDLTAEAALYQSGTEVDEYPGAGNFQAPRQPGPDTGVDEDNIVERVTNPDDNVPTLDKMIKITLEKL